MRGYSMRFTTGSFEDMYPEVVEAMEEMIRWTVAREASKALGVVVAQSSVQWDRRTETVGPLPDDPDPFEPFEITVYYAHVEVED